MGNAPALNNALHNDDADVIARYARCGRSSHSMGLYAETMIDIYMGTRRGTAYHPCSHCADARAFRRHLPNGDSVLMSSTSCETDWIARHLVLFEELHGFSFSNASPVLRDDNVVFDDSNPGEECASGLGVELLSALAYLR
jgi:hypothetical protein